MLFQAMVIFLPISIFFKILSERGKVHLSKVLSYVFGDFLELPSNLYTASVTHTFVRILQIERQSNCLGLI